MLFLKLETMKIEIQNRALFEDSKSNMLTRSCFDQNYDKNHPQCDNVQPNTIPSNSDSTVSNCAGVTIRTQKKPKATNQITHQRELFMRICIRSSQQQSAAPQHRTRAIKVVIHS